MSEQRSSEKDGFAYLDLWDAVAAAVPDRECIVWRDRRCSWSEVRERTARLSWWLSAQGAGARVGDVPDWESPNDLVGVLLRNRPEYLETTLACYRARCAPFNVNYRYTAAELAYLIDNARPGVFVFQRDFAAVVAAALDLASARRPRLLVVEDGSSAPVPADAQAYEEAIGDAHAPSSRPTPSPDDVHVLYTGGTTGMPKGVLWRQRDVIAAAGISVASPAEAAEAAPRRGWLRALPAPPLMHGAALWFAFNAWARGATIVLEDGPFDAAATVELLRAEHIAWLAIVGDAFATPLLAALDRVPTPPPDLTYVFSSGAALSARSWAGLRRHWPRLSIINALGSSETGPQAFQNSDGAAAFEPGPNTVVVSEDYTHILTAERPGTGWLANGGTLPRGYLGDAERTRETFRSVAGRRLSVSGDRAAIDASGSITFLGRDATVINTGGEKVFAEEVERVLMRSDRVADVLVLGRPHERWGQEVVALVAGAAGPEDDAELRALCAQHLAGYKIPKAFLHVDAVRRTASGKPDYQWAQQAAAQTLAGSAGRPG